MAKEKLEVIASKYRKDDMSLAKAAIDTNLQKRRAVENQVNTKSSEIITCPNCKNVVNSTDDVLPICCSKCGLFFQFDVEKIFFIKEQT